MIRESALLFAAAAIGSATSMLLKKGSYVRRASPSAQVNKVKGRSKSRESTRRPAKERQNLKEDKSTLFSFRTSFLEGQEETPSSPPKECIHHPGKLQFDTTKAGLEKVDKAYVENVIQESSMGSLFYENEQRREEQRRVKNEILLEKAKKFQDLSHSQHQEIRDAVKQFEDDLELSRDLTRRYIHIDMDMFYAAVEEKKRPHLKKLPLGVGSYYMLATTNYIARQYGVRSGMPGFIGRKLCPELVIVPTDFAAYRLEAATVRQLAGKYDVHYASVGLDELTMDVTDYLKRNKRLTAYDLASEFRAEIFDKTHLTSSAGIAPTSALAKIASNINKPNGQHEIQLESREAVLDYMRNTPIRHVPGIGFAQESTLNALGIVTCGQLLEKKHLLFFLFKEKTFLHYLKVGLGVMSAALIPDRARKSVGKESTFTEPLDSKKRLYDIAYKMLEECHVVLVKENLLAKTISFDTKHRNYNVHTYSVNLKSSTNDLKILLTALRELIAPHAEKFGEYRLIGVRLGKLIKGKGAKRDWSSPPNWTPTGDESEDYSDPSLISEKAPSGDRRSKAFSSEDVSEAQHAKSQSNVRQSRNQGNDDEYDALPFEDESEAQHAKPHSNVRQSRNQGNDDEYNYKNFGKSNLTFTTFFTPN